MQIEGLGSVGTLNSYLWGSLLYDLETDPYQEHPIQDETIERRMIAQMVELMRLNDAPIDQYQRLGLPEHGPVEAQHLNLKRTLPPEDRIEATEVTWQGKARVMYYTLQHLVPFPMKRQFVLAVETLVRQSGQTSLDEDKLAEIMQRAAPPGFAAPFALYAQLVKEKG
jgi:hypothetical protein